MYIYIYICIYIYIYIYIYLFNNIVAIIMMMPNLVLMDGDCQQKDECALDQDSE